MQNGSLTIRLFEDSYIQVSHLEFPNVILLEEAMPFPSSSKRLAYLQSLAEDDRIKSKLRDTIEKEKDSPLTLTFYKYFGKPDGI